MPKNLKTLALAGLRLYQRWLSPLWGRGLCRFVPSCSRYSYEAVERYGLVKGLGLSLGRLARCLPWHEGGYDPVP